MLALNILTGDFETVPMISDEENFTVHKPNRPPFQDHTMKTRSLWEHKVQQYVIWYKSGNVLMMHVSQCRAKRRQEDPDGPFSLIDVGREINAFTIDTSTYKKKLKNFRAMGGNTDQAGYPRPGTEKKREATKVSDPTPPAGASTSSAAIATPQPSQPVKRKSSETKRPSKRSKLADSSAGSTKARSSGAADAAGVAAATAEYRVQLRDGTIKLVAPAAAKSQGDAPTAAPAAAAPAAAAPAAAAPAADPIEAHSNDESNGDGGGNDAVPSATVQEATAAVVVNSSEPLSSAGLVVAPAVIDHHEGLEVRATEAASSSTSAAALENQNHFQTVISQLTTELNEVKRIHKNALQRHKNERKKTGEELQEKERELQETKKELTTSIQQQNVNSTRQSYLDAQEQKVDPIQVSEKLMDKCIDSLKGMRAAAEQFIDDELLKCATEGANDFFEYQEKDVWIPITDITITKKLNELLKKKVDKISYSIGSHQYEASHTSSPMQITQKNAVTGVSRAIRLAKKDVAKTIRMAMVNERALHMLLTSYATCDLTDLPTNVRYDVDVSHCKSRKLSELAELFSSCGSGFKYCVKAGTRPTKKSAKHFMSHTDGTYDFNSELFVKPMAIANWLRIAESRGLKFARLILHGASQDAYDKIKADSHGFDSQFAGTRGQAFGNGTYFGTSDHCSVMYNDRYLPPGTGILALMATKDDIGWQHHADRVGAPRREVSAGGSYSYKQDLDVRYQRPYTTMNFGETDKVTRLDDAVVVHDANYILVLGLVHAFCPKDGWKK